MKIFFCLKNKRQGISLPEVLLTLGIIGVISAITIPILNNSYQKNAVATTFSDTIKEFNKGLFYYSTNNNGNGLLRQTPLFTGDNNAAVFLASQFKTAKAQTGCWNGITIAENFDGSGNKKDLNGLSCFIDSDKIIYAIETLSSNCSLDLYNNDIGNKKHKLQKSCAILYTDFNGTKSPNAFGSDVFAFVITDNTNAYLYPVGGVLLEEIPSGILQGVSAVGDGCTKENIYGVTCGGRIIEDRMKVKYLK